MRFVIPAPGVLLLGAILGGILLFQGCTAAVIVKPGPVTWSGECDVTEFKSGNLHVKCGDKTGLADSDLTAAYVNALLEGAEITMRCEVRSTRIWGDATVECIE